MAELRCSSRLHGVSVDDHTIEVKCNSRFCGNGPGIVVLHQFDLRTGRTTTKLYKEPVKGEGNAHSPAVRTP